MFHCNYENWIECSTSHWHGRQTYWHSMEYWFGFTNVLFCVAACDKPKPEHMVAKRCTCFASQAIVRTSHTLIYCLSTTIGQCDTASRESLFYDEFYFSLFSVKNCHLSCAVGMPHPFHYFGENDAGQDFTGPIKAIEWQDKKASARRCCSVCATKCSFVWRSLIHTMSSPRCISLKFKNFATNFTILSHSARSLISHCVFGPICFCNAVKSPELHAVQTSLSLSLSLSQKLKSNTKYIFRKTFITCIFCCASSCGNVNKMAPIRTGSAKRYRHFLFTSSSNCVAASTNSSSQHQTYSVSSTRSNHFGGIGRTLAKTQCHSSDLLLHINDIYQQ